MKNVPPFLKETSISTPVFLYFSFLIVSLLFLSSCSPESQLLPNPDRNYLFLGHPYYWEGGGKRVDPRVETMYRDAFDAIWLGGDLCSETTRDIETLPYLDCLFDLDNPLSFWAVGNHDVRNGNIHYITETTNRRLFYTHHHEGITYVILMTGSSPKESDDIHCERKRLQAEMFHHILDTISHSSHLILLTHHNIWGNIEQIQCERTANACSQWFDVYCGSNQDFRGEFYQKLQDVQLKGINIIAVAGDGGQFSKGYEYVDQFGIHYLVSGINNSYDLDNPSDYIAAQNFNTNPDSVLIFKHYPTYRELSWSFVGFDSLVSANRAQYAKEIIKTEECR